MVLICAFNSLFLVDTIDELNRFETCLLSLYRSNFEEFLKFDSNCCLYVSSDELECYFLLKGYKVSVTEENEQIKVKYSLKKTIREYVFHIGENHEIK